MQTSNFPCTFRWWQQGKVNVKKKCTQTPLSLIFVWQGFFSFQKIENKKYSYNDNSQKGSTHRKHWRSSLAKGFAKFRLKQFCIHTGGGGLHPPPPVLSSACLSSKTGLGSGRTLWMIHKWRAGKGGINQGHVYSRSESEMVLHSHTQHFGTKSVFPIVLLLLPENKTQGSLVKTKAADSWVRINIKQLQNTGDHPLSRLLRTGRCPDFDFFILFWNNEKCFILLFPL